VRQVRRARVRPGHVRRGVALRSQLLSVTRVGGAVRCSDAAASSPATRGRSRCARSSVHAHARRVGRRVRARTQRQRHRGWPIADLADDDGSAGSC